MPPETPAPDDDDTGYRPVIARCREGPMLVNPRDRFIGRALIAYGEFSPGEARLFRALVGPGDTVVEAGANVGAFTLTFARTVGEGGRVHAFEPQRLVFQLLCANLALNGIRNVEAWQAGLGAATGQLTVPPLDHAQRHNFGGLALAEDGPGEAVPVTTVDNLGLAACALIKADVQGMEGAVLAGAAETIRRHRPVLYLENDEREHSPALIARLGALGYCAWWHLPPICEDANFRGNRKNVFPRLVSVNLLCLPDGRQPDFPDLRPGLRPVAGPQDWWRDR